MKIRFIDAGIVSHVRSQTIYHALGHTQNDKSTNTIVVAQPEAPYMCIGYFQDAAQELNLDYCKLNNLPVIRRETGGGAVYIDDGQLFVQWILKTGFLPRKIEQRFKIFVKPIIETYKFFGIDAYYHPVNDVHVGGRKIVGTGAGTIGDAEVVTGNFLYDFNYDIMLEALKVPDIEFKNRVRHDLKRYITTMKEELSSVPAVEELKSVYIRKCADVLGLEIEKGEFTDSEQRKMEELDKILLSDNWLFKNSRPDVNERLVKINSDVWIGQASFETSAGMIRTTLSMKGDTIEDISFDVRLRNGKTLDVNSVSKKLVGTTISPGEIENTLNKIDKSSFGSTPFKNKDWVEAIMMIKRMQHKATGNGSMERQNFT